MWYGYITSIDVCQYHLNNHRVDSYRLFQHRSNVFRGSGDFYSPSRSAPSSTSPMSPVPADDSSSNRESVLRSNAMFSMPLVGVLEEWQRQWGEVMPPGEWLFKTGLTGRDFWTTCRACIQWDPCPAQGWTQWYPAHLSCPHFQADLHKTRHMNTKTKDSVLHQIRLGHFWIEEVSSRTPLQHKYCFTDSCVT